MYIFAVFLTVTTAGTRTQWVAGLAIVGLLLLRKLFIDVWSDTTKRR